MTRSPTEELVDDIAAMSRLDDVDLEQLLLIRHFERKILALFADGHISGTTHTCLGQEYVPVALRPLLDPAFVFSNHRNHGHYLAQFGDVAGLLAEITGRAGAVCGGQGGSQHILRDGFCASGIQGQAVAVAVGVALHHARTGGCELAVAYVGDGTWGQGIVYEALNMASLWRAPLVMVVENNGIAQTTPTDRALAGTIRDRARAFAVRYEQARGHDIAAIRTRLADPVAATRRGAGPLVIEFHTDRLGPHSKSDDTRDRAELDRIERADWYLRFRAAQPERFAALDERMRTLVDQVASEVLSRPPATGSAV